MGSQQHSISTIDQTAYAVRQVSNPPCAARVYWGPRVCCIRIASLLSSAVDTGRQDGKRPAAASGISQSAAPTAKVYRQTGTHTEQRRQQTIGRQYKG